MAARKEFAGCLSLNQRLRRQAGGRGKSFQRRRGLRRCIVSKDQSIDFLVAPARAAMTKVSRPFSSKIDQ